MDWWLTAEFGSSLFLSAAIVGVIGERISDIPNNDFEEIHLDLIRWSSGISTRRN